MGMIQSSPCERAWTVNYGVAVRGARWGAKYVDDAGIERVVVRANGEPRLYATKAQALTAAQLSLTDAG